MTAEDDDVYAAETLAFEGTPLADRFDRRSLITETTEIASHPVVYPLVGDVHVSEATPRLVRHVAYARGQVIRFAPTSTERYTVVHELSHVAHARSGTGGTTHGSAYRAVYANLIAIVYGDEYGRLLRHAFATCGLPVASLTLPRLIHPIVDIDFLTDATREVRWL